MYYSNTTPNPYYANANAPIYNPNFMTRSHHGQDDQVFEAILRGIKREAALIKFYRQLANAAPSKKHKNDILQALEGNKAQLTHFTNLYTNLTGIQPMYQIDHVPFHSYRDGLQKAYELELEGYEDYQKSAQLMGHPQIQNVFRWALIGEQENATRFGSLDAELTSEIIDYGAEPFVVDIEEVTNQNNNFRTALWTGDHLQVTLMSIDVGEDIGLEIHPTLDQFLRIEQGQGIVQMGDSKNRLDFEEIVYDDYAIVIPAGKWHNLTNTGNQPLKLYSIYAPPQHPYGTIHETKAIAIAAEEEHGH
ncbi:cupin domain-containing protein [Alkalihalobacillus sp. MEB130]|uniref:cupin domain-containing protein n=1 Tax=Alkalihalobacillus sp. MEB130 TaxID=2976704 RepID=UPI0028DF9498|nr:cupin domain-containing protein [Alkalihalobacillus sp. MEB130]MDT8862227.1 cupin domain-containing protein [Alkalihalobacillus sp. MEB130]